MCFEKRRGKEKEGWLGLFGPIARFSSSHSPIRCGVLEVGIQFAQGRQAAAPASVNCRIPLGLAGAGQAGQGAPVLKADHASLEAD